MKVGFSLSLPKVALISEEFPPFMFGGIASVCHDLALALSKKGIPTTVFCGRSKEIAVEEVNDNLKIVRLPCLDSPPRFVWFQLQNLRRLSELLRNQTVLHIVNPEAGASIIYLGKKLKKPVVTSIHGTYLYALKKYLNSPFTGWAFKDIGYSLLGYPMHKSFLNICLKNSQRVAVCSTSTFAELRSLYPHLDLKKASVINNGIDFDQITSSSSSEERSDSIIFCGRLHWIKGAYYLIEAVASLRKEFRDIHVQIFGDGPLRKNIECMISDRGLERNVDVKGFVPRSELLKEIKESSLVVLPSLHEAQPVAMLEAMACGKPVVAFDFPFSREIIQDMDNGLLAKPEDVKDLASKIRLILADNELRARIGQRAFEYVRERHNWNVLVEKYVDLYTEAINSFSETPA
jgi:glycosyltransferase involved in cell wall biosynthesis